MSFMKKVTTLAVGLVCAASSIVLTGCSSSSVIDALNATVAAADAAVTALEVSGVINPIVGQSVVGYLNSVTKASEEAATELASTDSSAVKATTIADDFAQAVMPDLTQAPVGVRAAIAAVDAAIKAFLASVQSGSTPAIAKTVVRPSARQRLELDGIRRHAERVARRLADRK